MNLITTPHLRLDYASGRFRLAPSARPGPPLEWAAPLFEIDGESVDVAPGAFVPAGVAREVFPGVRELCFVGSCGAAPGLELALVVRVADGSAILRFRYELASLPPRRLTRSQGVDALTYLTLGAAPAAEFHEIRLSVFHRQVRAYLPDERAVQPAEFENGFALMGPILVRLDGDEGALLAYEHGSQAPDAYLRYRLAPDGRIALGAAQGNYLDGQEVSREQPFRTVWFEAGVMPGAGLDGVAAVFRDFVLRWMSPYAETRKPYIGYNTWNGQERNKWRKGREYGSDMNQERMLREIEAAGRMGIDLFVIDAGWSPTTGEWVVDPKRFDPDLRTVKAALDRHGMRLGLWFVPRMASLTTAIHRELPDTIQSWHGQHAEVFAFGQETASSNHCLISRFRDRFVDNLVRLHRQTGAVCFKLDALEQGGCDAAGHGHGDERHTPAERAAAYSFRMAQAIEDIAERVAAACPGAIVDFDVTEPGRSFGLSYLSAGRFFHVNNGPYFPDFDHPYDWKTAKVWSNLFVYPGPARGWVMRAPLALDRWIPSVLTTAHYLPDPPAESQWLNLASLMLGQNGIWGDLPALDEESIGRFGRTLALYKQVAEDIAAAFPVREGATGADPEIHEKINPANGRGMVAVFAAAPGRYAWVTRRRVDPRVWTSPGVDATIDARGRAVLTVEIEKPSAGFALFGVAADRAEVCS